MDITISEAAKACTSCLDWHKHCNAECCKVIYFRIKLANPPQVGGWLAIKMKKPIPDDLKWYYHLHGGLISGDVLRFRLVKFDYDAAKGTLAIYRTCSLLDGNLCKGHPTDKPLVCQELTTDYVNRRSDITLTPNCMFKYQMEANDGHN